MPLYTENTRFTDCWGSMGNISFYHRDGKCYWRTKPKTVFPGTPAQLSNAAIHRRAIKAWRELEHDVQLEWSAIAKGVPSKQLPYDPGTHISGYNLFVSAYHGFAQLGDEHTPDPKPFTPFPQFSITLDDATAIEEDLLITFSTDIASHTGRPPVTPDLPALGPDRGIGHLHFVLKLQITHPSGGIRPGLMRSFLSMQTESPDRIQILIPDYKNVWHLDTSVIAGLTGNHQQYQAHIRYFLIDSQTGYRSREQQISVRFEI